MRRLILLMVLLLLLPTQALADCAFVLWTRAFQTQKTAGTWEAKDSYIQLGNCKTAMASEINSYKTAVHRGRDIVSVSITNPQTNTSEIWWFEYRCLPAGTHPGS